MTKRQIKKEGYKSIVKNKQDHQSVYNRLKTNEANSNHFLAKELSKIPSRNGINKNKNLIYIFLSLMGIIMIIRATAIIYLIGDNVQPILMAVLVIGGVFAPLIGVFGALTQRIHLLQSVAFIFIFMLFRTFQDGLLTDENALVYLPFVVAIFFGLRIPYKMKTPFKYSEITTEVEGKTTTYKDYQFEKAEFSGNDELLDDVL